MADDVRFHVSLNVADLDRSVAFFRTLFGVEPAKRQPDYAKFEPADPPLVLSLEPASPSARGGGGQAGGRGPLNHLGVRLPDAAALVAVQERLERAGQRTVREDGVECCYAKQTKFWAQDPDGNLWEVYTVAGDLDHRGVGQTEEVVLGLVAPTPAAVVWQHRMGEPVPDRILQSGGRLFVHVLTGERPVDSPALPGPAMAVRFVPSEADVPALPTEAGFVGVRLLKYDANPCFVRDGVGLRELQLEAFAPAEAGCAVVEVMYRGPFRDVRDDEGRVYPRGRRVTVPAATAERLRTGATTNQFTVFRPQSACDC
jgi:catechol 2,3-dioxygenase-like lactoylglutathione lyase family enzyme